MSMKGRRGFLSGITKMGAAGGAALLVPRAAQSDLRKVPGLSEHLEEVFIEESYEVSTDEVRRLLSRVKELEEVILHGPAMFQGVKGEQGYTGPMGDMGMPGEPGLTADQVQSMIWAHPQTQVHKDAYGNLQIALPDGKMHTIESSDNNGISEEVHDQYWQVTKKELQQHRDLIHYLLGTRQQYLDDLNFFI